MVSQRERGGAGGETIARSNISIRRESSTIKPTQLIMAFQRNTTARRAAPSSAVSRMAEMFDVLMKEHKSPTTLSFSLERCKLGWWWRGGVPVPVAAGGNVELGCC